MHIIPRTPSPSPSRSSSREPSLERQGDTYGLPGLEKLIASTVKDVLANPERAAAFGINLGGSRLKEIKRIKKEKGERGRAPKRARGPKGKPEEIDLTQGDSEDDEEEEEEEEDRMFVPRQNRA